jgi:hypothetical protein
VKNFKSTPRIIAKNRLKKLKIIEENGREDSS